MDEETTDQQRYRPSKTFRSVLDLPSARAHRIGSVVTPSQVAHFLIECTEAVAIGKYHLSLELRFSVNATVRLFVTPRHSQLKMSM